MHADRGSSMRSKPVAFLLADLGVTKTHSRPYTSTDNPYSESQFKTMKYRPEFPARFDSIEHARAFCREFFAWYNHQHRHSGIGYMTPAAVHTGNAKPAARRTAPPSSKPPTPAGPSDSSAATRPPETTHRRLDQQAPTRGDRSLIAHANRLIRLDRLRRRDKSVVCVLLRPRRPGSPSRPNQHPHRDGPTRRVRHPSRRFPAPELRRHSPAAGTRSSILPPA